MDLVLYWKSLQYPIYYFGSRVGPLQNPAGTIFKRVLQPGGPKRQQPLFVQFVISYVDRSALVAFLSRFCGLTLCPGRGNLMSILDPRRLHLRAARHKPLTERQKPQTSVLWLLSRFFQLKVFLSRGLMILVERFTELFRN